MNDPNVDQVAMLYQDRRRACSFGADAERYDRARPSYPAALIDDLMAESPLSVLDVGCGTGKVARLFRERGCKILGVEPDSAMAAVARRHGIDVTVVSFEEWEPDRTFDLVVSGQAWHWVDPKIGTAKAAAALAPAGRFAAFWNNDHYDADVRAAFLTVYQRLAPELTASSVPGGTAGRLMGGARHGQRADLAAMQTSDLFEAAEARSYHWAQRYSTSEWLDQLLTHSDHSTLASARLAAVLDAIGIAIDTLGGAVTVHYQTEVVTALRKR